MAAENLGYKLYGIWKKKYKEHHGRDYRGSKYRDAATLKGVAEEIGEDVTRQLLDWYFENRSNHDISFFVFNYSDLLAAWERQESDREYVEKLRNRTREVMRRLEENDN
jgi:hypothetical protein